MSKSSFCKIKQYDTDVLVVGGGIAGISAALSSARNGAKTILAEPSFILGGLATSGLVTIYLPLCDGFGHQVSFGIAEELLRLSVLHGAEAEYPTEWLEQGTTEQRIAHRFRTQYNPHVFAILAEQLLLNAGVTILYGATLTGVTVQNDKIQCATLHTRSHQITVNAKSYVDCTGDATLCDYAGEQTELSEKGNVLACWSYFVNDGKYNLQMMGSCDYIYQQGATGGFVGLDGEELSQVTEKAHEQILDAFLLDGDVSQQHALATVATIPQVRMTRKLVGKTPCKKSDDKQFCAESVGMVADWASCGPTYEVPIGCLLGKIKNLAVAGRCVSVADDEMWDVMRVIPCCAVTGEAAGLIASMGDDFPSINVNDVQKILAKRGVKLHHNEVGLNYGK